MLSIASLCHIYPSGVEALRDITLNVARGEFVVIVGPSGCGKSTLLRLIAALLAPTAGNIALNGVLVTKPTPRIGIMFQDAALLPWRTVEGNVRLPLEVGREHLKPEMQSNLQVPFAQRLSVANLLDLVGLTPFANTLPGELSGGMAQRVALARALMTQPPVLLLDEPFGALDAMTRESLTASLAAIVRATGTTAVMVTHNIAEAVFLADRIVVLSPRPGQIASIINVTLPRPRTWTMESTPEFGAHVGQVREVLGATTYA